MPSAFVIMPFDNEFDEVYEQLIRATLENNGFEVKRADDIQSQRNILMDILEEIHNSDLIVADLTTSNPNVFYELGLAHAFKKPVILITQEAEEVPFDLRPYRFLEYSTHFARFGAAREQLSGLAQKFREGALPFGSPVTDFYSGDATTGPKAEKAPDSSSRDNDGRGTGDSDDRGFLDHLIAVTDGYTRISELVTGASADLQDLTHSMNGATEEFNRISSDSGTISPAAARSVCRRLAEQIKVFNSRLKEINGEYANIAQDTDDSLEFVFSFQAEQSEANSDQIGEQLSSLGNLRVTVVGARDSQLELAELMEGLPRIERRLNREITQAGEEIRVMANNLERTIASISRALSLHE